MARLLPPITDSNSPCMRFVDVYGDTVFNRLQMDALLEELGRLETQAPPESRHIIERVAVLARRCRDAVHLYLRFVGD